jgi:hypothetical protein
MVQCHKSVIVIGSNPNKTKQTNHSGPQTACDGGRSVQPGPFQRTEDSSQQTENARGVNTTGPTVQRRNDCSGYDNAFQHVASVTRVM